MRIWKSKNIVGGKNKYRYSTIKSKIRASKFIHRQITSFMRDHVKNTQNAASDNIIKYFLYYSCIRFTSVRLKRLNLLGIQR